MKPPPSPVPDHDLRSLTEAFGEIALAAGAEIMRVYRSGCAVRTKADRSPVTEADEAAEAVVLTRLAQAAPLIPVIAEETFSRGALPALGREFILVDALDGTREFLSLNEEFTVNIAFVRDGSPRCGVVYAPALRRIWLGSDVAETAEAAPGEALPERAGRRRIRARPRPVCGLTALASRSHCDPRTEAFLAELPLAGRRNAGSSLKFCLLAEGEADVYPRFGPTMEWDTAAGDAVLRAAGGSVVDPEGRALRYGKLTEGLRNPGFVAWGAPAAG